MTPISPITPIVLRERDERGGYIVPLPLKWWKFIFDAKTSTWGAYGRVAFVQARTTDAARAAGLVAAQVEFPASEIHEFAIGESTAAAAEAFAERRARHAQWMENTRTGTPNARGTL